MKGKIVLLPFPFTDLQESKLRPALVLYEDKIDIVVAFISSQIQNYSDKTDILILKNNPSFLRTGLKKESVVKLNKIATVLKELAVGEIGEIDDFMRDQINNKLYDLLRL